MSRRKGNNQIRTSPATDATQASAGITTTLRDGVRTGVDPAPTNLRLPPRERGMQRWLILLALGAAAIGIFLLAVDYRPGRTSIFPRPRKAPTARLAAQPWVPRTEDERLLDQFVKLHNARDRSAVQHLGPMPVFGEEPVSEKDAEPLQTDYFLRSELRIVDVWRGEPDGAGGQRAAPGRYTLVTKGGVATPYFRVRTDKGIDPPSQLVMNNPDLVVEVRDGKVRGVKSELHMGP
jgi:hypothetical protein